MKKVILLIALLSIGLVNAQEESPITFKKNELRVNAFDVIFHGHTEVSYERILSKKFGIGSSVAITHNDYKRAYFIPYISFYPMGSEKLTRKYASNFYIQTGLSVMSVRYERVRPSNIAGSLEIDHPISINVGANLVLGWKLVFKNNWIGGLHLGGGINFWKEAEKSNSGYILAGISIGKRF